MIAAPQFLPYPLRQPPSYSRWLASGVAVLAVFSSAGVIWRPAFDQFPASRVATGLFTLWLLALLMRVLYYRLNRHNAQWYEEAVQRVQVGWWQRHGQQAALLESVLIGPHCCAPGQRDDLLSGNVPALATGTRVLRVSLVASDTIAEREQKLAKLLVSQWQQQRGEGSAANILSCYWLGSSVAWEAFFKEMSVMFPHVGLPTQPQPWQGIETLSTLIDHLQTAPPDTRILCAGCESSPPQPGATLPAGEAAVLWLLAPQGGVRLCRGEWFSADREPLTAVAERALQQAHLSAPPATCVSFSQPDPQPDLPWSLRQHLQDAHFGTLPALGAMVAQTLAAWQTQQQGEPCAWLANDPQYTLVLGVVKPHDSSN